MAGETSESRVFMNFYYRITAGAASRGVAGRRGASRGGAVRGTRQSRKIAVFLRRAPAGIRSANRPRIGISPEKHCNRFSSGRRLKFGAHERAGNHSYDYARRRPGGGKEWS